VGRVIDGEVCLSLSVGDGWCTCSPSLAAISVDMAGLSSLWNIVGKSSSGTSSPASGKTETAAACEYDDKGPRNSTRGDIVASSG
jgi:hypothetical protein